MVIGSATGCSWIGRSSTTKLKWQSFPWGFVIPVLVTIAAICRPAPSVHPLWHERLLKHLPYLETTLLVGQYAQRHYLGTSRETSMTETIKAFSTYGPRFFPLPHPSWRSLIWMRKHPWFERSVIPELRKVVRKLIRE